MSQNSRELVCHFFLLVVIIIYHYDPPYDDELFKTHNNNQPIRSSGIQVVQNCGTEIGRFGPYLLSYWKDVVKNT